MAPDSNSTGDGEKVGSRKIFNWSLSSWAIFNIGSRNSYKREKEGGLLLAKQEHLILLYAEHGILCLQRARPAFCGILRLLIC
jgi:hypothetical protein